MNDCKMKICASLIILAMPLFFYSCETKNEIPEESTSLSGYWVNRQVVDSFYIFSRSGSLNHDDYGIAFLEGGEFIERGNIGFCATPPVTYTNYNGSYTVSDSIINIHVPFWGGVAEYTWEIKEINNFSFKLLKINEMYNFQPD